ncbi:MAG: hypothetical protein SGILL_000114 [Bacillariaceae sp.]
MIEDSKHSKSSICEMLDPNNDLHEYESIFDDDDRYVRRRPTSSSATESNDGEHSRGNFRTRITVHQNEQQYAGSQRSSDRNSRRNDQYATDFEPLQDMSLRDALWGSEESPDPIFSSTDPETMRKKTDRRGRNSTNGISRKEEDARPTKEQAQPSIQTEHERPRSLSAGRGLRESRAKQHDGNGRSKSTGRGGRVENFLQKLTGKNADSKNPMDQNGQTLKQRSRSISKEPMKTRSRSRSRELARRSRQTHHTNFDDPFGVDCSKWTNDENNKDLFPFQQDFASSHDFEAKQAMNDILDENARFQDKMDIVRKKSEKNAERLQRLDDRNHDKSCSSDKNAFPRRRLKGRFDQARVRGNDANEDLNGHYMYVAYSRFGNDAQRILQLCEHQTIPAPNPRQSEVLIRVETCTVSTTDCAIRRGEWPTVSLDPFVIPGVALVGRVDGGFGKKKRRSGRASFSFSSPIQPGDTVLSLMPTGANARYICLPKPQLVKVPPRVDCDEAVCLTENYLTAFQVLHTGQKGAVRYKDCSLEGRSILILGGYSALGRALIDVSITGGAQYCYVSVSQAQSHEGKATLVPSSRKQVEALKRWGAIPLSNEPQDWLTLIGGQIDMIVTVYDPSDHALYNEIVTEDHCKTLRKDGQIVVVCSHTGLNKNEECQDVFHRPSQDYQQPQNHSPRNPFRLPGLRSNNSRDKLVEDRTIWYNLFDSWDRSKPDRNGNGRTVAKKDLEHLLTLLEQDQLHPEVLERIPLSKIGKAQLILEHKRVAGHLVCAPWLKQQAM